MVVIACQRAACKLSFQKVAFLHLQRCRTSLQHDRNWSPFHPSQYSKPFFGSAKCMRTVPLMRDVRHLHTTSKANEIIQFHLSDIGEGIKEVTIKEW